MKRLLVIRFSALGDVAMLVPVVRALAEQHPEIEITMLSQERMADLFANMPENVCFHGVDVHRLSLREIVAGLGRYDAVADMHGVWRSMYIRMVMRLRGARVATIHKGRISKFLLTHKIAHKPLKTNILRYAHVLQSLGLTVYAPDAPCMKLRNEQEEGIGIAPFAAHCGKVYPIERMEEVVRILSERNERGGKSERNEKVVLFGGGQKEQEILDGWAKKYKGVESIAGKYSLAEELEIMRGLRVMISMDSANMHLASLVGLRVVSVWGATDPKAGFLGFGQRIEDCVKRDDLDCRPCSIYGERRCKYGDYRCMKIASENIVRKVTERNEDCH
ncbi:MAG: glycosyltransferase family 9 protein [Paludibacteraceae bacterium]|nr:glycosyltransferase family 9 protein [Paludibacteraceae bacterium]